MSVVSDGRLQLCSGEIILPCCAGVSWLAHGIALCALYGFLSPLLALIGPDGLNEVLLKGACLGRQHAQDACSGKFLC